MPPRAGPGYQAIRLFARLSGHRGMNLANASSNLSVGLAQEEEE